MSARRKPLEFYDQALPGVDISDLQGKLIVIEGPDSVGRSTQIQQLRFWLEHSGYAVVDTGMARSALTMKGIQGAKNGHTLGPLTMGLFYMTDFADRLENVVDVEPSCLDLRRVADAVVGVRWERRSDHRWIP